MTKELQGTDTLRWFNKQTPPCQHAAVSALKDMPKSSTEGARGLSERIIFFCSCISFAVTALGCSCRAFHLLRLHPAKLLPLATLLLQQRDGLCWHPGRCKSWHQGPYLCIFPRKSAEGQTWAASAWRHEPLLGEDNFSERSSVHLAMVGDEPAAAAPSWPSL